MRWVRVLLPLAVAVGGLSGGGCGRACDAIGCLSGVGVDVPDALGAEQFPVEATLCVDADCVTEQFTEGQLRPGETRVDPVNSSVSVSMVPSNAVALRVDTEDRSTRDAAVRLTVRSLATGATLIETSTTAKIRGQRPGGKGCEISCYSARLRYDQASATLVDE